MAVFRRPVITVLLCFMVGVWDIVIKTALQEANAIAVDDGLRLSNLDDKCLVCICRAISDCDLTSGCDDEGHCGPYKIDTVYWNISGKVVMQYDSKAREGAFRDCSLNFECAKRIVHNYMKVWVQDCNEDGVTDCMDYMMVHFNRGYNCYPRIDRFEKGRIVLQKFRDCQSESLKVTVFKGSMNNG